MSKMLRIVSLFFHKRTMLFLTSNKKVIIRLSIQCMSASVITFFHRETKIKASSPRLCQMRGLEFDHQGKGVGSETKRLLRHQQLLLFWCSMFVTAAANKHTNKHAHKHTHTNKQTHKRTRAQTSKKTLHLLQSIFAKAAKFLSNLT